MYNESNKNNDETLNCKRLYLMQGNYADFTSNKQQTNSNQILDPFVYSDMHLVVAETIKHAEIKLISHLTNLRGKNDWSVVTAKTKELKHAPDVNLEDRIKILSEIFPIIK